MMGAGKYALLVDNEAVVVHDTLPLLPLRDAGCSCSHGDCYRCDALA